MGRWFIGLLVLGFGAVWLLSNFGVLPTISFGEILWLYWPLILVYFGLAGLWRSRKRRFSNVFGSLFLIAVGVGVQLDHLGILAFFAWMLPVVFILGGIALLFGKWPNRGITEITYEAEREVRDTIRETFQDTFTNGRRRSIGSLVIGGPGWKLESGRYSHKLGDVKVDLRDTEIPVGETVMEINCKVGDIDVRLPDHIDVSVHAHVRMGDIKMFEQRNSGANVSMIHQSTGYEQAERKLKLLIFVKMGDIDVKRVD